METTNKENKDKIIIEHPIKNLFPQYERNLVEAELEDDINERKLNNKLFEFVKNKETDALIIRSKKERATITEANKLKEIIFPSIKGGNKKVILDLSNCEFMDSTFLGLLVLISKKLAKENGKIVLVLNREKIKIFHVLNQIEKYIKIFKNLDEAVSFLK
ncbi:MAG: hypothetical protein CR986_09935 [Ignavibacteriae bacterium]|nr:MAG: hypothetical protein CR986_09935 [Ignavibacteriota bacterium]